MAPEQSPDPPEPEHPALSGRAAAEAGAMVAEQVRRAIESAERSAEDLKRQALDRAATDPETFDRIADSVLDRIDEVEAKIGKLLQTLRDEVARTAKEMRPAGVANEVEPAPDLGPERRASQESPRTSPAQSTEPDASTRTPAARPAPARGPARPRRRGLFGRRRGLPDCAVCGRAPEAGEESPERWSRTGSLGLCPDCRQEGWQLSPGARLPYRPTRHDAR